MIGICARFSDRSGCRVACSGSSRLLSTYSITKDHIIFNSDYSCTWDWMMAYSIVSGSEPDGH